MPTEQFRAAPPTVELGHTAQLFDDPELLARTVAAFLTAGWQAGDSLLVVATAAHWTAIGRLLRDADVPVAEAIADGRQH
ncbi:MAG: hypothetical protein ABIT71_04895 [Vicinamibacteraceae bacterium]